MLTLAQATMLASAAHAAAESCDVAPLCVVVVNQAGHIVIVANDERTSPYRYDIALAKAKGCIGMGFGGREIARRAAAMPAFYAAVNSVSSGGLVPVAGGVLIRDAQGALLGAVGISGDTADNDERCAIAGIQAAGLFADTGAPS
jgi:uncharacterized protein GlcG (DUF336 family)